MRPMEKIRDKETVNNLKQLIEDGAETISVIMRHSDRHFHEDSTMEPFMGLTEKGKDAAFHLGRSLPLEPVPRIFSSFFGRCIETACLIDKGYIKKHGRFIDHNTLAGELSPFYIKDIQRAIAMVSEAGTADFLRSWFNNEISDDIIMNPEQASDTIATFMVKHMKELSSKQVCLCVSHDWNLFTLKEYKLGLKHENYGNVGYLESVIIFEKQGRYYITNFQSEPQELALRPFILENEK